MVWIGDRQITMIRGWIAQYKDGSIVCEEDMVWRSIPNKKDLKKVFLKWEDRIWSIDDKEHYTVPTKKGYIDITAGGFAGQGIASRTIGYYDVEGECKVILRVDESTGQASWETEPFK